jgi:hypothetical protein
MVNVQHQKHCPKRQCVVPIYFDFIRNNCNQGSLLLYGEYKNHFDD